MAHEPIAAAPPAPAGEVGEDFSPLGAALIQALQEAGEDPSELIKDEEE